MNANLLLALLYNGTLVAVCVLALQRGGRPERIGAVVSLAASAATVAFRYFQIARGTPAEISVLAIDTGVLACFFWLAIHTVRFWPVWAFGFALADVVVSLAGGLIPNTPLFAYQTSLGIYAYLALGALAVGTLRLPRNATARDRHGFRRPTQPLDVARDA